MPISVLEVSRPVLVCFETTVPSVVLSQLQLSSTIGQSDFKVNDVGSRVVAGFLDWLLPLVIFSGSELPHRGSYVYATIATL